MELAGVQVSKHFKPRNLFHYLHLRYKVVPVLFVIIRNKIFFFTDEKFLYLVMPQRNRSYKILLC